MKFTAYKHSIIKKKLSHTVKLFWCGALILAIGYIIYFIDNRTSPLNTFSSVTNLLFIIGIIPIIIAYFYQFFDYEMIEIADKGYLELDQDKIIIEHKIEIPYKNITYFKVDLIAYHSQRINSASSLPGEYLSLGLSNKIKISTDKQNHSFNFKLENINHQRHLEEVLFKLIVNEKFESLSAKKSIHLIPDRFRKSEDYKNYVIKQLVAKRINCTEGLLLHGYNSDNEAKELRDKYCG